MRWTLKNKPPQEKINQLANELQVQEVVATILLQRGITTFEEARNFFRPELSHLHNPFLMKDMDVAVARIEKATQNKERILVFGDYDVDGTTAVSLVASYLKTYYADVATYIPDRYTEGYGTSIAGIDFAEDNGFSLIIALDCGIKSIDHVAYAKQKNIDFIICDHHRPGENLPDAIAILDPKRDDCTYPYDELCGCGIGFKLIQALGSKRGLTVEDLVPYLDLVATAIAADIVPITGENRVLAHFGLKVINASPRPGIKALISQIKKQELNITDVVFVIAPRINAAGRIKHGNHAVALLTEFDLEQAQQFASEIEQYNSDRKQLDQQITKEALLQIEENEEENNFTSVVFKEDWHKGVIGIVASRMIENYYRPTVVFTKNGANYAASARSVKGFDVYNALEACSEHLEQFGGHKYAAGMTIAPNKLASFKIAFENQVKNTILPEMQSPEIEIDAEINFTDIHPKLLRILKQLEPFGPQNMAPVFLTQNIVETGYAKKMGKNNEHLRLFVKQNNSEGIPAIGFNLGDRIEMTTHYKPFKAVFTIDENEWNGKTNTQLQIKDLKL